jgi:hypothetical protein
MLRSASPRMYFASPVFGVDDRVAGGGGDSLPAELKGKSPAEIAKFYQDRETSLRAELDARPPARGVTPPPEPPAPSNAEFWNDPSKSVDSRIAAKALSKEDFDRTAASVRPALIWAAKNMVKEKYKDFNRVEAKVNEIMKAIPEWQHTDPVMWETVFVQARGYEYERLSTEDRVKPPVIIGEPVGPGGTPPTPNADLYQVTAPGVSKDGTVKSAGRVADQLGVSHDAYRKSQKILDGDGLLPLTVDNRRPR